MENVIDVLDYSEDSEYSMVPEAGNEDLEVDMEEVFRQEVRLWLHENAEEMFHSTNASWKLKKYTRKPALKRDEPTITARDVYKKRA